MQRTESCGWKLSRPGVFGVLVALLMGWLAGPALGQVLRSSIDQVEDVGVVRKEGAVVDQGLWFTDHEGRRVELSSAFDGGLPVVLCLAYFDCPVICPLTMRNLSRASSGMEGWVAGGDYRVLVISFDHNDTANAADLQRDRFTGPGFSHEPTEDGVLFWVAEPGQVKQLADSVGFYYKYMSKVDEFSHSSTLVLLTPEGVVHNYYPGIDYEAQTLQRLLMQAGSGGERSIIEAAFIRCFSWNPDEGAWSVNPYSVMQIVGGLTLAVVAGGLIGLWIFDRLRRRRLAGAGGGGADADVGDTPG